MKKRKKRKKKKMILVGNLKMILRLTKNVKNKVEEGEIKMVIRWEVMVEEVKEDMIWVVVG